MGASVAFPNIRLKPYIDVGFYLNGANFNIDTDQQCVQVGSFTNYRILNIRITNASISLTTAAGGFYSAASKGGTTLVAASQAYSALTDSTKLMGATFTADANALLTAAPYFSLTTPQGAAATADITVQVLVLS